ncbi:MAG: AAA domain-containing protein [bacterium]
MKAPKQIVFLKNSKSNDFVYTANIKSIRLDGNSYIVIFDNGNDYRYGRDKVLIYEFSSYRNEVNIYVDGQLQNQYSAAYDYHKYYLFAGQSIISEAIEKGKNIEIYDIKTNLDRVRATFEYFKEISAFPNLFNQEEDLEDNRSVNQTSSDIIVKALARIKIRDNVSVLANYLEGVTPITYDYNKAIIYPFGCNESQKCAVERALKNSVSIVEGPPGTGKTQTILNIIANVVSDNQSVAVVSNNNSAVYNIQEKLNKYGYGSLVATLGSNENKAAFFENQSTIERFEEAELSKQQISDVDKKISTISARITESLQKRNEVAKLKSMLKEVECQAQHFIAAHNSKSHK